MRRFLLALMAALCFLSAAHAQSLAPGSTGVPITGVISAAGGANVYSQPMETSQALAAWPQGTAFSVETLGIYWCRVTDGTVSGYVPTVSLFLDDWGTFDPAGENAAEAPRFVIFDKGVVAGAAWTLTLREKPDRKAKRMDVYVWGTIMVPLEQGKEYTLVHVGDKVGYLLAKYLTFQQEAQEPAQYAVIDNEDRVALRYNRFRHITYLEPGTVVTLISDSNGWSFVEVGGWHGYIVSTFLKAVQ